MGERRVVGVAVGGRWQFAIAPAHISLVPNDIMDGCCNAREATCTIKAHWSMSLGLINKNGFGGYI